MLKKTIVLQRIAERVAQLNFDNKLGGGYGQQVLTMAEILDIVFQDDCIVETDKELHTLINEEESYLWEEQRKRFRNNT